MFHGSPRRRNSVLVCDADATCVNVPGSDPPPRQQMQPLCADKTPTYFVFLCFFGDKQQ